MNPIPAVITMLPTLFGLVFGSYQWWMTGIPALAALAMTATSSTWATQQTKYADPTAKAVYLALFVWWLTSVVVSLYFVVVGV